MSVILPLRLISFNDFNYLEFSDNIKVYKLKEELRKKMLNILPPDESHKGFRDMITWINFYLYIESTELEDEKYISKASEFLRIMRIVRHNPASLNLIYFGDGIEDIKTYKEYMARIYNYNGVTTVNFESIDIDKLQQLWDNYTNIVKNSKKKDRIFNAVLLHEFANQSYYLEDQILHDTIALECLFSTDRQEIAFQISLRLSWFLYPEIDEFKNRLRKKAFADIKQIYRTRSKIVHGEIPNTEESKKEMIEQVRSLNDYVKMVIGKILINSELIMKFLQKNDDLQGHFNDFILRQ